jgi:hypothetical protein
VRPLARAPAAANAAADPAARLAVPRAHLPLRRCRGRGHGLGWLGRLVRAVPDLAYAEKATMRRTRTLCPRWLTVALVLWAAAWLTLPVPSEGAPLPPARVSAEDHAGGPAVELGVLREALMAQGLSAADAERVLARLTPAERTELAARASEVAAGGDATLLVVIGIILLLSILLYLPLAGRMQGWWQ